MWCRIVSCSIVWCDVVLCRIVSCRVSHLSTNMRDPLVLVQPGRTNEGGATQRAHMPAAVRTQMRVVRRHVPTWIF